MAPYSSRDLVIGLHAITTKLSSTSLLSSGILMFIDSTVPYIYLPLSACQAFESTFGLLHDPSIGLYTVNESLHATLLSQNPQVTFTISDDVSPGG
jgi:hypothetical protein